MEINIQTKNTVFDVYHPWKIAFKSAVGAQLTDENDATFLDCYGGHGVISIGHNHPRWKAALTHQLDTISYYSNAVQIKQQEEVANKLLEVSGLEDYRLFLCNSGAEANENAIKVASFKTGRAKVLAFSKGFHGRSAGAIALTDNPSIVPPFGQELNQAKLNFEDVDSLKKELETQTYAAVIIEGIQGVAGVFEASTSFWKELRMLCDATGTLLIADEIQSGCGRTGDYFAYQKHGVRADIVTMAKGIGNGFPVAAVLIDNEIEPKKGQLGTTFGGSYLACAAMSAVLDEIKESNLISHSATIGENLRNELVKLSNVTEVRGRGLMLGIATTIKAVDLQQALLKAGVVCGTSSCPMTVRILPPLNITQAEAELFLLKFKNVLKTME